MSAIVSAAVALSTADHQLCKCSHEVFSKTWSALGVHVLLQNRTAFYCSLEMLSVSSPDYWGKNVVIPLPYSGKKVPQRTRVRLPVVALSGNNLGQVVCTHVPLSLTKQYNLVKGR